MVPGPEERGPKTLQTRRQDQELHDQREGGFTGKGNPELRAHTTVPTDGLKPVVPEPEGRDPKTLEDTELSPRSRWGKWHQQRQELTSKDRQQDVEERRGDLPNYSVVNQGPQGPQGPWFGRLRRQGPPITAHNGGKGRCEAASQPELRSRPGRHSLDLTQGGKKSGEVLRGQDLEAE